MARIGKVSSVKKEFAPSQNETLAGSLNRNGYNRFPSTMVIYVPARDINGEYITGLNPNALYIQRMKKINPEEAEIEIARVTELKERLEAETGLDLSSRSDFYSKMYDEEYNTKRRASVTKLNANADNIFNLDDPYSEITFSWLRVHPDIAPSLESYRTGKVKNTQNVFFYIKDDELEQEVEYDKTTQLNKAIAALQDLSPERMYKVGRLLGLAVSPSDKPSLWYNSLNKFITSHPKNGDKLANVRAFNKVITMTDENFHNRYLMEEAIRYNIYRVKTGKLYEGDTAIADSKEDFIKEITLPSNQERLIKLEEDVRQAKAKEISI